MVVNSKIHVYCGRSRNLSEVKSHSYFISKRPLFPKKTKTKTQTEKEREQPYHESERFDSAHCVTNKKKERNNGTQKGNIETERKWNVHVNADRRHNVTQTQRERVRDLKWQRR